MQLLDNILENIMRIESSRSFWAIWGLSLISYAGMRRSISVVTIFFITVTAVIATNLLEIELVRPAFAALRHCRLGSIGWQGFDVCRNEIGLPSNHAARAAAAAAVILWGCRTRHWRILAFLAAAGVGVSRVYFGVHHVSDVLWAVAIGGLVGTYYYLMLASLPSKT